MISYQRLSIKEREELSRGIAQGLSIRAIALRLGRSPSSISRELRRFSSRAEYRAYSAHQDAGRRARSRKKDKKKIPSNVRLRRVVHQKLALFWSPEQIAVFLKRTYEDTSMHASAETIYSYIYVLPRGELREELSRQLRRGRDRRRSQKYSNCGKTGKSIEEMISIEERPEEVASRTVPGHWEGDLIIGKGGTRKQSALGTLVERTTRAVILVPVKNKTAQEIRTAFAKEMKKLPKELRLSITYDRGKEMAEHRLFTKQTKIKVYFAHPRSPWERGTSENTNGLLRQFFPKNTDFTKVSRREIKKVQKLMNERPRKTLNWKTPQEAMEQLLR